jgi:excisionase family DNA binding protein
MVTQMLKVNDKVFLSLREAARQIGVSVDTLSRHLRQGTLNGQRFGRYRMVLVELAELQRWHKEVYNATKAQIVRRYWAQCKRKHGQKRRELKRRGKR